MLLCCVWISNDRAVSLPQNEQLMRVLLYQLALTRWLAVARCQWRGRDHDGSIDEEGMAASTASGSHSRNARPEMHRQRA